MVNTDKAAFGALQPAPDDVIYHLATGSMTRIYRSEINDIRLDASLLM